MWESITWILATGSGKTAAGRYIIRLLRTRSLSRLCLLHLLSPLQAIAPTVSESRLNVPNAFTYHASI